MARHDQRVGYGLPTILAIVLHLAVLLFSVMRFPQQEEVPPSSSIVQATLVSTETTTDQAQRAEEARARAQAREAEAQRQSEEGAEPEAEASEDAADAEAKRRREKEAERQAEAREREEALQAAREEAQRRAEEAEQQAEERRQRQAEQEAAEQRRREEEAERQRQAEQEAAEQRRREEEAERQRQAEQEAAEQRRREEEARRAAEVASQGLERAIEGESESVANARQAQEAANSFIALVRRAVEQAWVIPPNSPAGASAEVSVRLGPSGELFSANITQASGDGAFDRSVIQAVEAAAPFRELRELPSSVQRDYRQFTLRFRPGDIR